MRTAVISSQCFRECTHCSWTCSLHQVHEVRECRRSHQERQQSQTRVLQTWGVSLSTNVVWHGLGGIATPLVTLLRLSHQSEGVVFYNIHQHTFLTKLFLILVCDNKNLVQHFLRDNSENTNLFVFSTPTTITLSESETTQHFMNSILQERREHRCIHFTCIGNGCTEVNSGGEHWSSSQYLVTIHEFRDLTTPCVTLSQLSHELLQIVIQWQFKFCRFLFPFIPFFLRSIIKEIFPSIIKSRSTHNQITETLTSLMFKPQSWLYTRLLITSQALVSFERSYQIVHKPS